MSNYLRILPSLALAAFVSAVSTPVFCQGYPTRPITMIVPTGPGGTTDIVARIMSGKLADVLGRPVVVENKVGAGGIIGTQAAAKAAPDGHTLMMSSNQIAMIPPLYKTSPFDPVKSFIPITSIGLIPTVAVVNPQIPVSSFNELLALAKRKPDGLSFASAGNGSPNHLFGELLNNSAGVQIQHIPYKGIAAALSDVVGGRVSMAYASLPTVQSFIDAGRLKALAVTSPERSPRLPNVQTIAESVPGYNAEIWIGLWAVANTPDQITERIHAATMKTLADPDIRKRLTDIGLVVEPRTMPQFQSIIQLELEKWSKIVRDSKGAIEVQ